MWRRVVGSAGADRPWTLRSPSKRPVTCIACGESVPRSEAREYDREGDRWDRRGKCFEYLCKDCDGDIDHKPRDEVEALLVEVGAGECDRATFLAGYCERVEERYGPLEE